MLLQTNFSRILKQVLHTICPSTPRRVRFCWTISYVIVPIPGIPETRLYYTTFCLDETRYERERRIQEYASTDPWLALVITVTHFEWNVGRTCIALGREPNIIVRNQLKGSPGLSKLSRKWEEILDDGLLQNLLGANMWREMICAHKTRNRLVHG